MLHQPVIAQNYRETRDFACESKFLLSAEQADLIRAWARANMGVDPHGNGEHGDLYQVSSIYFDTVNFDVFQRNGSYGRSKYRIRRYNAGDTVFLERKTKTDTQVSKRRTQVHLSELSHLSLPPQATWSGYWFQRRLKVRSLQPVCQISYQRVARLAQAENGPCRLTLDNQLSAQVSNLGGVQFATPPGTALLPPERYILELKYRYSLPVLFRRLLSEFAPLPQRVSKYRLAIDTLALTQPMAKRREVI
ncbi:MAG: polyphosphate polymerase domain-containing protein [Steroidobacteraceae bacterium]